MQANISRRRAPAWKNARQQLRQDGQLLRFKVGGVPHGVPLQPTGRRQTRPVGKISNVHKLEGDDRLSLGRDGPGQPFKTFARSGKKALTVEELVDEDRISGNKGRHSQLVTSTIFRRGPDIVQILNSALGMHLGGPRGDPFNSFPIEGKSNVQSALDYFAQVYAPVAIRRPEYHDSGADTSFFSTYFQFLLHDPMYFEAIIAFSQILQILDKNPGARLTRDVIHHSSNVLRRLQNRLSSGSHSISTSNAVILTIVTLMVIDYFTKNQKEFEAHLTGLRRVVVLRGGLDELGWGGFVKARILALEVWWRNRVFPSEENQSGPLKYPSHPFSAELCLKIATLPTAFRELALSKELSTQVLDLVSSITSASEEVKVTSGKEGEEGPQAPAVDPGVRGAEAAIKLLETYASLTTTERLLVMACLAYSMWIDRSMPGYLNRVYQFYLQTQVRLLEQQNTDQCDREFVIWVALVLRITTEPGAEEGSESSRWAREILQRCKEEKGEIAARLLSNRIMFTRGRYPFEGLWQDASLVLRSANSSA